jgi:hypothetical protein
LELQIGQLHLRELKSNVILEDLCNDVACAVACTCAATCRDFKHITVAQAVELPMFYIELSPKTIQQKKQIQKIPQVNTMSLNNNDKGAQGIAKSGTSLVWKTLTY